MLLVSCLAIYATSFGATEPLASWSVQFERNVGLRAEEAIWQKSTADIQHLAKLCQERSDVVLVCRGTADTVHYSDNHFAQNAVIALQRSIVGYNLAKRAGVPIDQILMGVGTEADSGFSYRTLTLAVYERSCVPSNLKSLEEVITEIKEHLTNVDDRLNDLERLIQYLLSLNVPSPKVFCLSFGLGGTSTAFSGTPYINGTLTWKQIIAVDAQGGLCPWTFERVLDGKTYNTRTRFVGTHLTVYLKQNGPIGITVGYERHEQLNTTVGEYLQRHESFTLGVHGRLALSHWFDLVGDALWLPGEHYVYPKQAVTWPTDRFRASVGININLGGRK